MSPLGYYDKEKITMRATRYIHYIYIYIYIIGIAFLLQGCNRESHPATPDTTPYAIGMSPSEVRGGTRALIDNLAALQASDFRVYGYKVDKQSYKQQVFTDDGQTVSYDATDGWTYSPVRYWDRVADYCFAAYAPATLSGEMTVTNEVGANQTLRFSIPQWQVIDGSETDLLVASSQGAATEYLNRGGVVNLAFDHIYAQLEVQILRNAFLVREYKLTSLHYKYVPSNADGTYTHDFATPANSTYTTTILSEDALSVKMMSGEAVIAPTPKAETTFKHLVVPFTTIDGGFKIVIGYTVDDGAPRTAEVSSGLKTVEAGQRYVLRLNFNSGADIIPSLTVEDWIREELDEDDKYNW